MKIRMIEHAANRRMNWNGITVKPGNFFGYADGVPCFWSGWTSEKAIRLYTLSDGKWSAEWVYGDNGNWVQLPGDLYATWIPDLTDCEIIAQPETWGEWAIERDSEVPFFAF